MGYTYRPPKPARQWYEMPNGTPAVGTPDPTVSMITVEDMDGAEHLFTLEQLKEIES